MTQALADGWTTTYLDNLVVWFRLLGRLPADLFCICKSGSNLFRTFVELFRRNCRSRGLVHMIAQPS